MNDVSDAHNNNNRNSNNEICTAQLGRNFRGAGGM